jgi:undecaprenyl-diphosphatase
MTTQRAEDEEAGRSATGVAEQIRRGIRWIGAHELSTLLFLLLVAGGAFFFVKVASEIREGDAASFDRALLLALRTPADLSVPIGPRWVEEAARDLTALGSGAVLTLITLAVEGYLLLLRKRRAALFLAAAVLGAVLLSVLLKDFFARPRPEVVPHLARVFSASFPSGHSMLSTAVYLTLGAMLTRVQSSLLIKAYIQLWALLLASLVGLSRVYLGVHWPTDVLAGWAAGAAWAALCWMVAGALHRPIGERAAVASTHPHHPPGEHS